MYGDVATTSSVQLSSKKTAWTKISINPTLAKWRVLTLTDVADVPCLLSDGTILIGGIVGKDSRVNVNGSARIWSPFPINQSTETASN